MANSFESQKDITACLQSEAFKQSYQLYKDIPGNHKRDAVFHDLRNTMGSIAMYASSYDDQNILDFRPFLPRHIMGERYIRKMTVEQEVRYAIDQFHLAHEILQHISHPDEDDRLAQVNAACVATIIEILGESALFLHTPTARRYARLAQMRAQTVDLAGALEIDQSQVQNIMVNGPTAIILVNLLHNARENDITPGKKSTSLSVGSDGLQVSNISKPVAVHSLQELMQSKRREGRGYGLVIANIFATAEQTPLTFLQQTRSDGNSRVTITLNRRGR